MESMSILDGSSSSSLSGLGRFFVAGLVVFSVVCTNFFGPAFGAFEAAAFLGPGLAFAFFGRLVSLCAIEVIA
jgi:hypothetical protein